MRWTWFIRRAGKDEWPVVLLALAAALLVLTGLGSEHLWQDEADTAVLARGIVKHGLPVAWDGAMLAVPDFGQRLTPDLVMVSHPWLQYYLTAASFALLGETAFAARLPFALAGVATVVVVYFLVLALLGSRRAAVVSALLLVLNVQFLLFARQARNYTLHALLTCSVLWLFFRLESGRRAVAFTLLGILLFHAHPLGLVTIGVLGLLTLVYRPFHRRRRWFWPAAATIGAYSMPWLLASKAGYAENAAYLPDASRLLPRLMQFLVECASVTPLLGVAALWGVIVLRRGGDPAPRQRGTRPPGRGQERVFSEQERAWLVVCAALGIGYALVMAVTQSRDVMWIAGVRQTAPIIPLSLTVAALLIGKVGRSRTLLVTLVLLFGLTNLGRLTPWVLWADAEPLRPAEALVGFHVPLRPLDGILRTAQLKYVASLLDPSPGVVARISEFLTEHAEPGDLIVTNYAWEAVYFHTRLPQALKVQPSFPIYDAVRDRLPDFVHSARAVRWIVWRQAWAPAWGQDCERLLRELSAARIPVRLVASLPETLYENRENLHARRFGERHLFPWFSDLPPVLIYRVDWPGGQAAGASAR